MAITCVDATSFKGIGLTMPDDAAWLPAFDAHCAGGGANAEEGAAYGVVLLAAAGSGVFRSVEAVCKETIKITGNTVPGKDREMYEDLYPVYRAFYPALKQTFHMIDKE